MHAPISREIVGIGHTIDPWRHGWKTWDKSHKGFIQTGQSLVNPLLCCLSKYRANEITLCKQGLSCGIRSLDHLGTSLRNHRRNLGLCFSTVHCSCRCR